MKLRKFLAAATAITLLLGVAATPEVGSEIKLALTAHAESGEIPIDAEHFPDANFREYVERFDTDENGSFSAEEIAEVTMIDCSFDGISSLKGIEYFTALTYLDCGCNELTTLDVSKITKLTDLSCYGNQLTKLNVSKNTALTYLHCSSNQLTSLDVSKNTKLTDLDCNWNKLSKLDISKNTALTYLDCSFNELTSLNVSKNTALEYLDCSDCGLTELDVSNNTALEELECYENRITSLDASKNTELIQLWCYDNQLTKLDVSKNTALTELDCSYNNLTSLDVTNCPSLKILYSCGNHITTLDLRKNAFLSKAVRGKAEYFDIYKSSENKDFGPGFLFRDDDAAVNVNAATRIILNDLSDDEIDGVAINEKNFPDWSFRGYVTSEYDTDHDYVLSKQEITAATELSVSAEYTEEQLESIKGIEFLTSLKRMFLTNTDLTSVDLSKNTALTEVYIQYNDLLSSINVSSNTKLLSLYCDDNKLAELDVSKNTELTELYCWGNQLTSLDVSKNTSLDALLCEHNQLTSLNVRNNAALTRLECGNNQLKSIDLSGCTALENLDCSDNLLIKLDISKNANLHWLQCGYNALEKIDVTKNTLLRSLDCAGNKLAEIDVSKNEDLSSLVCFGNNIKNLDISNNQEMLALMKSNYGSFDNDNYLGSLLSAAFYYGFTASSLYHLKILEDFEKIIFYDIVETCQIAAFDKTTQIQTTPEVEAGTADVSGMKNNPNVDVTEMGITFKDNSGKTYSAQVQADGKIMLPSLPAGEYTVTASLENCPSREYTVKVESGEAVELDVELKLYGDINGDGRATTADLSKINEQVQMLSELPDYDNKVADVNGDGKVTTSDLSKINEHVQQLKLMW